MTPYSASGSSFPVVQIYDLVDPVLGGISGEANIPVKQLADRTQYLYSRMTGFFDVATVGGIAAIDNTYVGKLVRITGSANSTLTLADTSTFRKGDRITFKCELTGGKFVAIGSSNDEAIIDGSTVTPDVIIWLLNGESVTFIAEDSFWVILNPEWGYYKTGNDDLARILPRNTAIAQGQIVNRADQPRLWKVIQSIAISDTLWLSNIRYQGFFSLGNGTTTFRFPDMRSQSLKALDLGRGLSFARLDNSPGGYEKDGVGNFSASVLFPKGNAYTGGPNAQRFTNGSANPSDISVSLNFNTGNLETTVKNIGLYPIIYL